MQRLFALINLCVIISGIVSVPVIWNANDNNNKAYFFMPVMDNDCKPWSTDCFQETSAAFNDCLFDNAEDECAAYSGPREWCNFYHEACSCKVFTDKEGIQRSGCMTRRQDLDALGRLNSSRTIHAYCSNSYECPLHTTESDSKSLYELKTFVRENLGYNPFEQTNQLGVNNLSPEDFERLDRLFSSFPLSVNLQLREILTRELPQLNRRSLGVNGASGTILPFADKSSLGIVEHQPAIAAGDIKTYSYIPTSSDVQTCYAGDHTQCSATKLPKEWCMIPPNMKWHGGGCNCERVPNTVGLPSSNSDHACVQQREDLAGDIQWTFCNRPTSPDYCSSRYLLNQKKDRLEVWHTPVIPGQPDVQFVNASSDSYECFNNDHCAGLVPPKAWCNKQMNSGCACKFVFEGPGRNHIDNKACIVLGNDSTFTYCTPKTLINRCR